jgi:3-hydroxybutyryl-CoA dehydrogenase
MGEVMNENTIIGVVGAGTMGAGIAQVAAAAGHKVLMYDALPSGAAKGKARVAEGLDGLVTKGKMEASARDALLERMVPVDALEDLAPCGLVIEAILEDLGVKRDLFAKLEAIAAADTVLATNTSSISITAIAKDLKRPGQFAGLHFFNPAPVMKLVEIVSGLATEPKVAEALFELAKRWRKVPVYARSTPGFIVNRIARPFYAEALMLLQEQRATPAVIDACLRAAGFRMGPCELMDLIGHDVNFAVTESVYHAYFDDRRFIPSLVQRELVDGGRLGRKSGQGFYPYGQGAQPAALPVTDTAKLRKPIRVHGAGAFAGLLAAGLQASGAQVEQVSGKQNIGLEIGTLRLWLTDGRPAGQRAQEEGTPALGVFDLPLGEKPDALAVSFAHACPADLKMTGLAALKAAGFTPIEIGDAPGLVVARTIAMIINEAADAVQQGVCDPAAADTAMTLGVNYPAGPFAWLAWIGPAAVAGILDALAVASRSERYRVSPWLMDRVWAGEQA